MRVLLSMFAPVFLPVQHWYWHPYMHFISLSFAPTCVIGLTKDLQLPASFTVTTLAKPSDFAYVRDVALPIAIHALNQHLCF